LAPTLLIRKRRRRKKNQLIKRRINKMLGWREVVVNPKTATTMPKIIMHGVHFKVVLILVPYLSILVDYLGILLLLRIVAVVVMQSW